MSTNVSRVKKHMNLATAKALWVINNYVSKVILRYRIPNVTEKL